MSRLNGSSTRAVRRGGEGGGGRIDVLEQRIGAVLEDRPAGAEIGPERLERAAVEVAERLRGRGELGAERDVEERIAGMRGEAAEQIGPEHRPDHRPETARRRSREPAVRGLRKRSEPRVDEADDVVAEVAAVVADRRRVDPLRTAERGEAVDGDEHRVERQRVELLGKRRRERRDVEPGARLRGHRVQQVDRGVAPFRLGVVVARRPDEERPGRGVAERVPLQGLALERELLPAHG